MQRSIHDQLVERLVKRAQSIRVGDPFDPATEVGPLIHGGQLAKVKEAMDSNDADRIKSATDELERLFSQAAAAAQGAGFNPADMGGAPGSPPTGDASSAEPKQAKGKVVDADFEVVEEDKKA